MKRLIAGLKSFGGKNLTILALFILLLAVLTGFVYTRYQLTNSMSKGNLVGTYIHEGLSPAEAEYFVLNQKAHFYQYIQLELLERGAYQANGEDVYQLTGEDGTEYILIYSNQKLYFFDSEQNTVTVYTKISDTPTFINIDERGELGPQNIGM